MSRRERRGAWGLLVRQAATDAPLEVIVAVVVAVAAFLVSVGPGALAQVADRELRHTLEEYPAIRTDLTAAGWFGYANGPSDDPSAADSGFEAITTTVDGIVGGLLPPLASVLGDPQWAVATPRSFATVRDDPDRLTALVLGMAATPAWRELVTFVDGAEPTPWTGTDADEAHPSSRIPVPVALSRASAELMEVDVGDTLDIEERPVVVTGIYEPVAASDPFWAHRALLSEAAEGRGEDGRTTYTADVLIAPGSTVGLQHAFLAARIDAWYPPVIDRIHFGDAPRIAEQIRELSASGIGMRSGEVLLFTPQLASDLDDVTARVSIATALFALLIAGPLGVVLAVLALAAGAIGDRRSAALSLARARGASGLQLRTAMLVEGAILAIPSAAIGAAIAFAATGGRTTWFDLWPAALFAAAPALLLAIAVPRPAVRRAGRSGARWVIEVLVVGLAAASLFLLYRRGIVPGGAGIDPLLTTAPLLIAAAVTIGVLRVYPVLLRAARRSARRGRGAVGLVGTSRAVHSPSLGFAAAFALIVGVSVAVFSAGMAVSLAASLVGVEPSAAGDPLPLDAGHPLVAAVFVLLTGAAALPLLFCIIAILLAVVAAARSRDRTVGVLRVLGFSAAQVRGLIAWELVPVAIVAIVAGVALGVAEVYVLNAALAIAPPRVDAATTVGIAVVFAAATAVAAAAATAVARRRTPGSSIRMGTE